MGLNEAGLSASPPLFLPDPNPVPGLRSTACRSRCPLYVGIACHLAGNRLSIFFQQGAFSTRLLNHFLTGLFALICFLTKYNYGLVVLFTEAICYLVVLIGKRRAQVGIIPRGKTILIAWLPVLGLLAIWLFVLDEWQWLVAYSTAQPSQYAFWSYENLLFTKAAIA